MEIFEGRVDLIELIWNPVLQVRRKSWTRTRRRCFPANFWLRRRLGWWWSSTGNNSWRCRARRATRLDVFPVCRDHAWWLGDKTLVILVYTSFWDNSRNFLNHRASCWFTEKRSLRLLWWTGLYSCECRPPFTTAPACLSRPQSPCLWAQSPV